jgi:Tfp pilus assembly protein PilZ
MQFLKARFHSRDEFLEAYSREMAHGGLFIPTTTPLEPGTPVVIDLTCSGLPNKVLLRATVHSWRPALPRLRVRAGALVAFEAQEREKREFVLATLGGAIQSPPRRKYTRIPVSVPVKFRLVDSTELVDGEMVEISLGGALVKTETRLPEETDLVLSILPPGGIAPMEIAARVAYLAPGRLGVKFLFRDGGGARRLRELIRRIRTK